MVNSKKQTIIDADSGYSDVYNWLSNNNSRNILLVCGNSINKLEIDEYLRSLECSRDIRFIRFNDFTPNPDYDSVIKAIKIFRDEHCDAIFAVGGGSAMDVAKCIKLYAHMDGDGKDGSYLKEKINCNNIPLLVMPTTAGTGSEITSFAVIYYKDVKQSISDINCVPDAVIIDAGSLNTLPIYQKKATMLDALCHAIESFWSVRSTKESMQYSRDAINLILDNMDEYLNNTGNVNKSMLVAANLAGKAINIAQTTAGHAMSYKITKLFGCAHGHAVALCVRELFKWMSNEVCSNEAKINIECMDPRGIGYLKATLNELGRIMGYGGAVEAANEFSKLYSRLGLYIPTASEEQLEILKASVNQVRLKNHPVMLKEDMIDNLYRRILRNEG